MGLLGIQATEVSSGNLPLKKGKNHFFTNPTLQGFLQLRATIGIKEHNGDRKNRFVEFVISKVCFSDELRN